MGCIRSKEAVKPTIQDYDPLKILGVGSYGYVYEAKDLNTRHTVAIKRANCDDLSDDYDLPLPCRREIDILSSCHHPNIIRFKASFIDHDLGAVFIVMEHASTDLGLYLNLKNKLLGEHAVKKLMRQLLRGVSYLHSQKIIHRDLKPDNILVKDQRKLKICDFGLSKRVEVRDGGECDQLLSQVVVSRRYRSPELLLGEEKYTTAIDVWSVGCIFAEMVTKEVLFPGSSDDDQLSRIYSVMGSPELETELVGDERYDRLRSRVPARVLSDEGFDLLRRLLEMNPARRISARDALKHPWFLDFSCF